MKALVDHGGIVQFKYILRNYDDVMAYHEINSHQHGRAMLDFSDKPNRVRDVMTELSNMRCDSMLITATRMANDKTTAMMKHIKNGKTIVVNMVGGWCFWDDSEMIEYTFDDFMDTVIGVNHHSKIPSYSTSYIYPDLPRKPDTTDIYKLFKTKNDRKNDVSYALIQWTGENWCHVCTECDTIEKRVIHTKQMNRIKEVLKISGIKIVPRPEED